MEELISYNSAETENFLLQVKKFLMSKGIMLTKKFSGFQGEQNSIEDADPNIWIKPFIIQTSEPAFYLNVNSPDDIDTTNEDLDWRLTNLQKELKKFLENNSDLDKNLADKINTFASTNLTQAKKFVNNRLKRTLQTDSKNCNSVEELQQAASKRYGDFIKTLILEKIMVPLYEGIKQTPKENVYLWTLERLNNFLAELGVATVDISVGDVYNENSPYVPAEESQSEQYATTNPQEKDTICKILRYAYAFKNGSAENNSIMDGEVIVMIYRPEGAK